MSKRTDVLEAIKRLIQAALPEVPVIGLDDEEAKPEVVGPDGLVIVRSGMPGDPEIDLSPRTYWWEHVVPIEVATYGRPDRRAQLVLDDMIRRIDLARQADPYLGGLCIFLDATMPVDGEADHAGAVPVGWADFNLVPTYSTTSPLG